MAYYINLGSRAQSDRWLHESGKRGTFNPQSARSYRTLAGARKALARCVVDCLAWGGHPEAGIYTIDWSRPETPATRVGDA